MVFYEIEPGFIQFGNEEFVGSDEMFCSFFYGFLVGWGVDVSVLHK